LDQSPTSSKEASKEKFKAALAAKGSKKITAVSKTPPAQKAVKEEVPILFPDLFWVWGAYCFLNERRQVGPNGPQPISVEAMQAYSQLTNRIETTYREQLLLFIPELDRLFLHDFYAKQQEQHEEMQKKQDQSARRAKNTGRSR